MKSRQYLNELEARGYKFCRVLNRGKSGDVYECVTGKRKQSVAIKIPHKGHNNNGEACILSHLMKQGMKDSNIVTCLGEFTQDDSKILVFEKLDVNLQKYISQSRCKPLPLTYIRDVVKQMASVLSGLSEMEIIHTDIKPTNIMTVKPNQKSFQIKLIDFGCALPTSDSKQGSSLGTIGFKSPEIMLGLPFTQATDVWSLGCVVAYLLRGRPLFNTQSESKAFRDIHQILGQPSDELLDKGSHTRKFYKKCHYKWSPVDATMDFEGLTSLDDLKPMRVGLFNKLEPIQREQCVELLKRMLQINPEDRITPEEIKNHPFITGHYQRKSLWSRFMPFKRNNKVSPLPQENQVSQHTLNTRPSEKVFKFPRVLETTAKTEGQKTYAKTSVEEIRHSLRRLKDPGLKMAPTSINTQPSGKPGFIWDPPLSGPTDKIEEFKMLWRRHKHRDITEPKLKIKEMSVKDNEKPLKPSPHRVVMVEPAPEENTMSWIDSKQVRANQTNALDTYNRYKVMQSQQAEDLEMDDANQFRATIYHHFVPVCVEMIKDPWTIEEDSDMSLSGLTTIGKSESSVILKDSKSNLAEIKGKVPSCAQSKALDNWQRNMKLRKRQQDHLSALVHRPVEHLQMNDANRFREMQEKKERLNRALPLVTSGYGLSRGFWRLPERYGEEPNDIVTTLTKADRGIRKQVTQSGFASSIRQESGLKEEHTVNDAYRTWDQSIYLKQQCQMLGEAVRGLDFNRPDIDKLEVIGSSKPYLPETCSDPSSEGETVKPVILDLTPCFAENVEDPAEADARRLWKMKVRICTVPLSQLTFEEREMYLEEERRLDPDKEARARRLRAILKRRRKLCWWKIKQKRKKKKKKKRKENYSDN